VKVDGYDFGLDVLQKFKTDPNGAVDMLAKEVPNLSEPAKEELRQYMLKGNFHPNQVEYFLKHGKDLLHGPDDVPSSWISVLGHAAVPGGIFHQARGFFQRQRRR